MFGHTFEGAYVCVEIFVNVRVCLGIRHLLVSVVFRFRENGGVQEVRVMLSPDKDA